MVHLILAAEEYWVSQAFDLVLHVHLGSDAEGRGFSREHVVKDLHVLFWSVLAVFTFNASISFFFHLVGWSVVGVHVTIGDQLSGELLDLLEVVRSVTNLIRNDGQRL